MSEGGRDETQMRTVPALIIPIRSAIHPSVLFERSHKKASNGFSFFYVQEHYEHVKNILLNNRQSIIHAFLFPTFGCVFTIKMVTVTQFEQWLRAPISRIKYVKQYTSCWSASKTYHHRNPFEIGSIYDIRRMKSNARMSMHPTVLVPTWIVGYDRSQLPTKTFALCAQVLKYELLISYFNKKPDAFGHVALFRTEGTITGGFVTREHMLLQQLDQELVSNLYYLTYLVNYFPFVDECSRNCGPPLYLYQSRDVVVTVDDEPQPIQQLTNRVECKICMESGDRIAFVPCGHALVCTNCSNVMQSCPFCFSIIERRVRLFVE